MRKCLRGRVVVEEVGVGVEEAVCELLDELVDAVLVVIVTAE